MTHDEIISSALDAGFDADDEATLISLERFAALVAAHVFEGNFQHLIDLAARKERVACAKLVEDYCGAWDDQGFALAEAIRARGEA